MREESVEESVWVVRYEIAVEHPAKRRSIDATLTVGWDAVALERKELATETDDRLVIEPRSGRRSWRDRAHGRCVTSELGADGLARMLAGMPGAAAVRVEPKGRTVRVGEVELACARISFDAGDFIVEALAAPLAAVSPASALLCWALLTGHHLPEAAQRGIPLEVVVRRRGDLAVATTRILATSIGKGAAEALAFDAAPAKERRPALSIPHRRIKAAAGATARPLLRANLPGGGPDVAWMATQHMLDRARDLANKVTRLFGTFTGAHTSGPPGLHLDPIPWFSILRAGLSATGLDALDGLTGLWLMTRAFAEEEIPSMSPEQRDLYRGVLDRNRSLPAGTREGLIASGLIAAFGDEGWLALAAAELAPSTLPFAFAPTDASGAPITRISGVDQDAGIGFVADDFDLTVQLGNRANVDKIETRDGAIALGVSCDSVTVDFRFLTWAIPDLGSGELAGELARGVLSFNAGFGTLTITSPMLTFDLRAAASGIDAPATGPAIGITATYNRDESSFDATLDLKGVNLAHDLVVAIGSRVTTVLEDNLTGVIAGRINGLAIGPDLGDRWPDTFHARSGPPLAPATSLRRGLELVFGAAELLGYLAPPAAVRSLVPPGTLDPNWVTFSGFALSASYLGAWLRSSVPGWATPVTFSVTAFEQALGVTLPRAPVAAASGGGAGGGTRSGATTRYEIANDRLRDLETGGLLLSVERAPRFIAARSMTVVLPPEGASATAGTLRLDYDVGIHLAQRRSRLEPDADPGFVDPRDLGGAHGDPVDLGDKPTGRHRDFDGHVTAGDEVVTHFVDAVVRVEVPLVVALAPGLDRDQPALPELAIAIPTGGSRVVTTPELTIGFPLSDEPAVRQYLEGLVAADADLLLARLRDPANAPIMRKPLIPFAPYDAVQMNRILGDLVAVRQASWTPGDPVVYVSTQGWLYWSWDVVDTIDACFA